MASPTLLLLPLLLGALAAVNAIPLNKGEHPEELVTRCIVEVLSNALGKANAPPINPECKEILKKSGQREKEQKKSENENVPYEQTHMNGEEQHQNEEEAKRQHEESEEKQHLEWEDHKQEDEKRHVKVEGFPHEDVELETDENPPSEKRSGEMDEEDKENAKVHHHSEERYKEKKHHEEESENPQQGVFEKRPHSAGKSMEDRSDEEEEDKRSAGSRHSGERMPSDEKRSRESEEESNENHPHQMKRPGSHLSKESEESDESKDVEKQYYKPRYYHKKARFDKSTDEKKVSHSDKRKEDKESEEADSEETHYRDRKSHTPPNYDEEPYGISHHPHHREKINSYESHSSEQVEKKGPPNMGSEGEWEKRNYNTENPKQGERRHDSGEREEERNRYEKRRHQSQPFWGLQPYYEEKKENGDEIQDTILHYAKSIPEEKRHYSEYQESAEEEPERQRNHENKEEKRHYYGEESEEKRHYPTNAAEEEDREKRHQREEKKHTVEESEEHMGGMKSPDNANYEPYYNIDLDKRAAHQYSPYNKQLWWKNKHFEKRSNVGAQTVDSGNVNKHNRFSPEYNDYDLWEKRQLMEDVHPDYIEKRNPSRIHKFDIKRQYNRMDELAQLLNYKKKSVELPDLYNSEEGFKKRHMMQTKRGNLIQRPLTEEEEKELENLAAMDLELQKIAEKLNDNRRG